MPELIAMISERISNTTSDIECHARDIAWADRFAQEVSESPVFPTWDGERVAPEHTAKIR